MNDITERLPRSVRDVCSMQIPDMAAACEEAADTIDRLRRRVAELEAEQKRTERYFLQYCETFGKTAAALEWCIEHSGECLDDHQGVLKTMTSYLQAARSLADAEPPPAGAAL